MKYAVVNIDGLVENVIELDEGSDFSLNEMTLVAYTDEAPAKIGGIYISNSGLFSDPQPYASWGFDDKTVTWNAPVKKPIGSGEYVWLEETQEWFLVPNSDYEVE